MHSQCVPRRSFATLNANQCLIMVQMPMKKRTEEHQKMRMEVMRVMKNNHVSFEVAAVT